MTTEERDRVDRAKMHEALGRVKADLSARQRGEIVEAMLAAGFQLYRPRKTSAATGDRAATLAQVAAVLLAGRPKVADREDYIDQWQAERAVEGALRILAFAEQVAINGR